MRTGRSLTVCCSVLPGGGGSPWSRGGGGVLPGPGGGVLLGPKGGSAWSRGGSPETPPVNRITDTCKNITLATTSLRPVKKTPRFWNNKHAGSSSARIFLVMNKFS